MKIKTRCVNPSFPVGHFKWCAVDDDTYEPGRSIGWGPTEQAAIDDLMAEIEEDAA